MKRFTVYIAVALLSVSCGQQNSERVAATSVVENEEMAVEAIEGNVADAISSLSDANDDAATSTSLMLLDNGKNKVVKDSNKDVESERSCVVEEDKAIVSVEKSLNREKTIENRRGKIQRSVEGRMSAVRTWSSSNGPIGCKANGNQADIPWDGDVTGLKLHAEIDHSSKASLSITKAKTEKSISMSRSRSIKGTREISWLSSVEADGVITREKSLVSAVFRTHSFTKLNGSVEEMEFNAVTGENAPLKIKVLRDASTLALKEKTIVSGSIVASNDDGKVDTAFSNVRMIFSSSTCSIDSGTIETSIYKTDATEASRKLKLVITDGVGVLTDESTGEEIVDFDMPGCSLQDFQS